MKKLVAIMLLCSLFGGLQACAPAKHTHKRGSYCE